MAESSWARDREFEGEWWLATAPKDRVRGKLIVQRGEFPRLIVEGTFDDNSLYINAARFDVFGIDADGRMYSLCDCVVTDTRGDERGSTTIQTRVVMIGSSHIENALDTKFDKIEVSYAYLNEWVGLLHMYSDCEKLGLVRCAQSGQDVSAHMRTVFLPDNDPLSIPDGTAHITYLVTPVVSEQSGRVGVDFPHQTTLRFTCAQPLTLDLWEKSYIGPFRDFLSLALGTASFTLTTTANNEHLGQQFEVIAPWIGVPRQEYIARHQMLFTFEHVADRLHEYLPRWYEISKIFHKALGSLFSVDLMPGQYLNNRFFNVVSALEAYHRISPDFSNLRRWSETEEQRINDVLSSTHGETREWIESYFKNVERPLNHRIDDLKKWARHVWGLSRKEMNSFIDTQLVTDTRNYAAHLDLRHNRDIARRQSLFRLMRRLIVLMYARLLHELQLPNPTIRSLVREHIKHQRDLLDFVI